MSDDVEAMVKREIAAARRIIQEDRLLKSHGEIKAKLDKHFPDEVETEEDGKPKAPDKKPEKETSAGDRKPGIWWGGAVPSE